MISRILYRARACEQRNRGMWRLGMIRGEEEKERKRGRDVRRAHV
jgi:hypothetical protein